MSRLARIVAVVALMLGLSVGAASAAPTIVDPGAPSLSLCSEQALANSRVDQMAANYLPLSRWGDELPFHTRLSLLAEPESWMERNAVISNIMGAGNTGWKLGTSATQAATRFCVGESTTRLVDKATGTLGTALFGSGIMAFIVVAGLVTAFARAGRSGGMSTVMRMAVTSGVLVMLVSGAMRTTDTSFGKGSPGWWGSRINQTVDVLATAPVGSLDAAAMQALQPVSAAGLDSTDCRLYTGVLRNLYQDRFGAAAGGSGSVAVAPRTLDAMWQGSGLATWTRVQFGANQYGPKVACRLMERASGAPVADTGDIKGQFSLSQLRPAGGSNVSSPIPGANPDALAWSWRNDEEEDRALVGWAACAVRDGKPVVVGKWGQAGKDGDGVAAPDCEAFFTEPVNSFDGSDGLDYDNDETIREWANQAPDEASFLLNLHGTENSDAKATASMFLVSSWVTGITYTLLAVAVFVAKAALVVMVLAVIWVLLSGLVRPHEDSKVVEVGKQYVVIAFFAFATSLMLSMLALITNTLFAVGQRTSTPGSFDTVLWAGLSPIAAIFMFRWLFKKLGAPSPFKPTAALAWGAAAAGSGMLAGVGIERHLSRRGTGIARSATRVGERAVRQRLGMGGGQRRGAMAAAAAGGAAAGAMTGAAAADLRAAEDQQDAVVSPDGEEQTLPRVNAADARAWAARGRRDLPMSPTGQPLKGPAREAADKAMQRQHQRYRVRRVASGEAARESLSRLPSAARGGAARAVRSLAQSPGRKSLKVTGVALAALAAPVSGTALAAAGATYAVAKGAAALHSHRKAASDRQRRDEMQAYAKHLQARQARDNERAQAQVREAEQLRENQQWAILESNLEPEDHELRRRELAADYDSVIPVPRPRPRTPQSPTPAAVLNA